VLSPNRRLDRSRAVLYDSTMAKHSGTLEQIRRLNPGLHWRKVEAYLRSAGADVYEGSGSTVTFVLDGRKLTVDRPHPRRDCGIGLVKRVRSYLQSIGHL
jgi:predicted RNA binding protein YcfA (HicA-like mRNA interferase family)